MRQEKRGQDGTRGRREQMDSIPFRVGPRARRLKGQFKDLPGSKGLVRDLHELRYQGINLSYSLLFVLVAYWSQCKRLTGAWLAGRLLLATAP